MSNHIEIVRSFKHKKHHIDNKQKGKAGATTKKGLISHECYPYRVRHSVMHRGGRSQTNGWALWHHSLSTFFASRTNSIDWGTHFHPLWCSAALALHEWLTGRFV
ncbi:hypothetical protein MHH52_04295 [Paenibacillus sp. FSL K6-0276]|uniref:hypothetical protein n=1 Tax=Paenibacillus sp. FSL K6-0276 TaxID=2921450 RepID=UPI0030ED82B9